MRTIFIFLTVINCISYCFAQTQEPPNWHIFNTGNSDLLDNRVYHIYYDSENLLHWAATFDGGLTKIDGWTTTTFSVANSDIPTNKLRAICASNGKLWIGTKDRGIVSLDTATMSFTEYNPSNSGMPSYESWGIAADTEGNIWAAAGSSGLVKFDGLNWTVYNSSNSGIAGNWVNYVFVDNAGVVWTASGGGFSSFDGSNWNNYNVGDYGRVVIQHSDGSYWLASSSRLTHLVGSVTTDFTTSNSQIPDNDVSAIAEDLDGNLWIGTVYGGVAKYDGVNFELFNSSNSTIPDDYIETIVVSNFNTPWIGMNDGGLAGFKEDGDPFSSIFELGYTDQPNAVILPAGESFKLDLNDRIKAVELLSINGQLIESFNPINKNSITINVPYISGVYLIKLIAETSVDSKYLLVQ